VRQTGELIRRARNAIEVGVGQRPATGYHHDMLDPEIL
jgi:hypothetical protein